MADEYACAGEFVDLFFRFRKMMRLGGAGAEISVNETGVLYGIASAAEKRLKIAEVGKALGVKKAAATQSVDRLVKKGLVRRERDRADRRIVYAVLTERGTAFMEERRIKMTRFFEYIVREFGEADAAEAQRLLKKYFEAVERYVTLAETEENHA